MKEVPVSPTRKYESTPATLVRYAICLRASIHKHVGYPDRSSGVDRAAFMKVERSAASTSFDLFAKYAEATVRSCLVARVETTWQGDQSILSARVTFAVAYNSRNDGTPRPPHDLGALTKSVDVSTGSWKQRFTSLRIARSYSPADCLMLWNFAIVSWNVNRGST
ncbi:hypothetical protein T10_9705 [Trichinella papuae]|uniref:Uncharacterized protein n=2 Tax=Trichinella papuae TaxID=268474 RepID=A0A0V1M494_9BILA|nr:hypothetical protein T10_9705 [Trichinella papuae]